MEPATIVGAAIGLVMGLIILAILGLLLSWLWNSTLPDVLGVKTVTTWQAIKIMFIASMLFGGHRVIAPPDPGAGSAGTPVAQATRD